MYLHEKCKNCEVLKNKKCKGYQFLETLKDVKLTCKKYKESK
ncbi:MAG: hypothetical protein ACRCX2_08345 [Paraclostridium sp.]